MLSEITDLYYFNSGRWDVKFKNDLLIKLPINKLDNSINIAKKFIEKEKITGNIIIDLRVANQESLEMGYKDIFSIIDYGSSNLRLGIFENYPPFNKFLIK